MSLSINNNVGALNARNNLNRSQTNLNDSIERLSTGFRVNRGADGPAALVISERQRSQIAGLRTAIDNTEQAATVIQTAEGALNEINSILTRVRSLALNSANAGVNDADSFAANQAEIDNALETINRISENTQFGQNSLLDGSAGVSGTSTAGATFVRASADTQAANFNITIDTAGERANVTAGTAQAQATTQEEILSINGVSITIDEGSTQQDVIDRVNEFSAQTGVRADNNGGSTRFIATDVGAAEEVVVVSNVDEDAANNVFTTGVGTTEITAAADGNAGVDLAVTLQTNVDGAPVTINTEIEGNLVTGLSGAGEGLVFRIDDSDASDLSTATTAGTLVVTDGSLDFQVGANANQTASISIGTVNSDALGGGVNGNQFQSLAQIDVTSGATAQESLAIIDQAITEISNVRGELGAFQANSLESIANNLRTTLENTVNAESVIRDTDFAEEISNFTNQQVLVQAGTSVLSNANQTTQGILTLLG